MYSYATIKYGSIFGYVHTYIRYIIYIVCTYVCVYIYIEFIRVPFTAGLPTYYCQLDYMQVHIYTYVWC